MTVVDESLAKFICEDGRKVLAGLRVAGPLTLSEMDGYGWDGSD